MKKNLLIVFILIINHFPIRRLIWISTTIAISTLFITNCEGQWVQTNGPYGGGINSFAQIGNNIFAGTSFAGSQGTRAGIFYSTNNGLNWIPGGLDNNWIRALTYSNNILYAGTYGGVYESTNYGLDWNFIGLSNFNILSLAIKNGNIFAGVSGSGLFFSSNNGTNWEQRVNGLNSNTIISLNIKGNYIYAGGNNGFYFSTDDGLNWSSSNNLLTNKLVRSILSLNNKIYAGSDYYGVFSSTNNGIDWISIGLDSSSVYCISNLNNTIYAGTNKELFSTSNEGITWNSTSYDIKTAYFNTILLTNSFFLAGTDNGIFYSSNNGTNWISTGLPYQYVIGLSSQNSNLYAACPDIGVFKSTNNGLYWQKLYRFPFTISATSILAYNSVLIAGTYMYGLYISYNDGLNWSSLNLNGSIWYLKEYHNIIYGGPYRSTNGGINWTNFGVNIPYTILSVCVLDSSIFAGTQGGGVYISSNNGVNWIQSNNGLTDYHINSLEVSSSKVYAGTNYGIFVSTNKGNSWDSLGLMWYPIGDIKILNNNIFAGSWNTVFCSNDYGVTWRSKNNGFVSSTDVMFPLLILNNYLFTCTEFNSVWRIPLQEVISVKNISTKTPDNFKLFQNYPNPFNSSSKIKFCIPENGKWKMENNYVTLKIYNILGKEITTLVNEKLQSGTYEVNFDGSNLPSGIYFYRFSAGDYSDTKKVILIK